MKTRAIVCGLSLSLLVPVGAHAQTASSMERFGLDLARKDSNADGPLASGQPEVTLAATEAGGEVAALLGFKFNQDLTSFTLKVAGPLEKGAEEAELVNLAALPGGTSATFRLSHAWSVDRPAAGSLTTACRAINSIVAERLPRLSDDHLGRLNALEKLKPVQQWSELKVLWGTLEDEGMYSHLVKRANRLGERLPPSWDEIEGLARSELCAAWNAGRASTLLLDPVKETRTEANPTGENEEISRIAKPCTVKKLLRERSKKARAAVEAALPDLEKVESKAAETRAKERAIAEAELVAARARAAELRNQGISADAVAVILASAESERSRIERETQRAYDATVDAAIKKQASAGDEAAAAEDEAVYKALVAAARKRMSPTWDSDMPFLRKPAETEADFQCTDLDAAALLGTLKPWERGRVFRQLVSATPTQWFLTGEYKASAQDFKYIADPIALNPETNLVATKSTSEYNNSGRAGLSLQWRGTLSTVGFTHKSTWEAKPSAQFCFPRGGDGGLVCATTASGSPGKTESDIWDAQWKRLFTPSLALHAQVFFETDTDAVNPHLIAYFLPETKKLRGGLDFSYLNKDPEGNDGFGLRLFIGLPFSLGAAD